MMKYVAIVGILLLCSLTLYAQRIVSSSFLEEKSLIENELTRYRNIFWQNAITSRASEWLDVTYYRLNLTITTDPQNLRGDVTINGIIRQNPTAGLTFDLMNTMQIDSVKVNGTDCSFRQDSSFVVINIDSVNTSTNVLTTDIFYRGVPVETGFGSFIFGSHSGTPWVWSLSEPYGARDWFPCKDHPSDKADSADIIVTCDSSYRVGSNGKLISVVHNGDGTCTHHWQERYPIASYLISIALTNYEQFSDWFRYSSTDSMEILNYVLPENFSTARGALSGTTDMLQIYSDLFGLYPFVREKYGHADFGKGGAMEHQTMTSTTTYNENTIAHELAHQWFGDMITCCTWKDLWLNEGFAQYSTALYLEKKYGTSAYWSYINYQMSYARYAEGTLYVEDTAVVRTLFSSNLVYSKGASVLHMLRHVLGDSVFFRSLKNYANDTTLKYNTASTSDFQRVCEASSGTDLSYFFDEWVYGENVPVYTINWSSGQSQGGFETTVILSQSTGTVNPPYFTMPVDIKLVGDIWDTTVTVFNNLQQQQFTIHTPQSVSSVVVDPKGWILKTLNEEFTKQYFLYQNYPNPFLDSTHIIYRIPKRMHITLSVFNMLGQKVATLVDETQSMGEYEISWHAGGFPSGIYFYRLQSPDRSFVKKLMLLK